MIGIMKALTASRSAAAEGLQALGALRDAVVAAKGEVERIRTAPPPPDEVMARLSAWIDGAFTDASDALRPQRLLADGPTQLEAPVLVQRQGDVILNDSSRAVQVLLGLVAGLNKDAFLRHMQGQVTDLIGGRQTMNAETRQKKLAQATARVLEAEMAEEAACRALEQAGISIARRPDASPAAVLAHDASLPK